MGPLCLIINPSAGGGRAATLLAAVEAALRARGASFRVLRTGSLDDARRFARDAVERGEDAAAMGGDGLVGAVAGELRGTDSALLVLPGGRGNDFARKLGLGDDPVAACALIEDGKRRAIDIADAGGRAYLGIASAGIDSDVQVIANRTRLPLGGQVYTYGALRALATWKPAHWTVTIDGDTHDFDGYSVAVCNSGVFGGGMYLVPDADLSDGVLDIVLTATASKLRYIGGLGKVKSGRHVNEPSYTRLRGREVTFTADRPFDAYADGDPLVPLPATITVQPGALTVISP